MIEVKDLTKYYGEHAAIRDLTFTIERGEVIGFLGPQRRGEIDDAQVLGCVLLPTAGDVRVDGIDIAKAPHEIRRRIGFLPDSPPLYNEMTVGRYLAFVAQLRGVPAGETAARVAEAEEKTATRHVHDELISSLSHGFRQRVGVAQALVHKPKLLILDEPTSGLDPLQIIEMRSLIRNLRGAHTILLSSHILSEISQTCDRLLVIQDGRDRRPGHRAGAGGAHGRRRHGRGRGRGRRAGAAWSTWRARCPASAAPPCVREADGVALVRMQAAADLRPKIARVLVNGGLDLLRIDRGAAQLESIFLQLTKTHDAEDASAMRSHLPHHAPRAGGVPALDDRLHHRRGRPDRRRPAVQRLRARRRREAVVRGAEPVLLLLERHDHHRQRLHLDAPASPKSGRPARWCCSRRRRCTTGRSSSASSSRR